MCSIVQESNDQYHKLLKQHSLSPMPTNRDQNRNHKENQTKKKQERFTSVGKKFLLKNFWIEGNIQTEIIEFLKK